MENANSNSNYGFFKIGNSNFILKFYNYTPLVWIMQSEQVSGPIGLYWTVVAVRNMEHTLVFID